MGSKGAHNTGMSTLYSSIQDRKDKRMMQLLEVAHLLQKMLLILLLLKINRVEDLDHYRFSIKVKRRLGKMDAT
jgi:hypothetical protein